MREGMNALEKSNTWEIVDKPKREEHCSLQMDFKYKANGSLERYKARFVAKRLHPRSRD